MKKILFYSHDAYGVEHIRRAVSICQFLLATTPGLSIKILTGSSMMEGRRLPGGIEYIQLPGVAEVLPESMSAEIRDPHDVFQKRSEIILRQVVEFQPDLMIVDGAPYGVQHELLPVLAFRQQQLPKINMALILQDVIDGAAVIKESWKKLGYFEAMERQYDQLWVLGIPRVFDVREEYGFSVALSAKTRFLGYMRRSPGLQSAEVVRGALGIGVKDPLVVLNVGGEESDVELLDEFLNGVEQVEKHSAFTSLILLDPEMARVNQQKVKGRSHQLKRVKTLLISDDVMSYFDAANLVVTRAGYQSMCEVLTLNKAVIAIPKVERVQEQTIRASRTAKLGLVTMIPQSEVTAERLIETIKQELREKRRARREAFPLSVDALPKLSQAVAGLLRLPQPPNLSPFPADGPGVFKALSLDDVMRRFFSVLL